MALPNSGNIINLSQIQTQFGGNNPINLSEYYNNGTSDYVINVSRIPTTGSIISFGNFYTNSFLALPTIISNLTLINKIIIVFFHL